MTLCNRCTLNEMKHTYGERLEVKPDPGNWDAVAYVDGEPAAWFLVLTTSCSC